MLDIRRAVDADAPAVADVFLASFGSTYPTVRQVHSPDEVRHWIEHHIVRETECWVATDAGQVVAMMALTPGWIDQLYVAPDRLGEGVGRRLVDLAKMRSAGRLELWTFQVNDRARRFYERNGFVAVESTDGDGNDEREPDVRYVWSRPSS